MQLQTRTLLSSPTPQVSVLLVDMFSSSLTLQITPGVINDYQTVAL